MYHTHAITGLGAALVLLGVLKRGWGFLFCWLGFSFLWLGIAHLRGAHRAFAKRSDGTLPLWSKLLHLPFFCYTTLVWHALRLLNGEPAQNRVTEHLVIGRRLLSCEIADDFTNYVDLTAEFAEPRRARQMAGYISYPILDADAPSPESLRAAVSRLRPGMTYIHCAQGHGRAGLFALAVLLANGAAQTVDDGLRILVASRPTIRLSPQQRRCIDKYARR